MDRNSTTILAKCFAMPLQFFQIWILYIHNFPVMQLARNSKGHLIIWNHVTRGNFLTTCICKLNEKMKEVAYWSAIKEKRESLGRSEMQRRRNDRELHENSRWSMRSSLPGSNCLLHSSRSISCQLYGPATARPHDLHTRGTNVSLSWSDKLRNISPSASGISSSHSLSSLLSPIFFI